MARGARAGGAALGLVAGAIPALALWGFTVDDALITARVAHRLALGEGHRFNASGPVVDAVTPLGWEYVLAPFARSGVLAAFAAARWIGLGAWLATAAWIGHQIAGSGSSRARFAPLAVMALSAPLGAWAGSGMETAVVTALATVGIARVRLAPLAAGLAAGLRPELLPWAMLLAVGTALGRARRPLPALGALALALGPAAVVAAVRWCAFGTAMPLAVLAKPASLSDGVVYATAAFGLTAVPALVLAPFAARRLEGHALAVLVAGLVHFPVLALAGGDWMPLFRLAVPVLPGLIWVAAELTEHARPWATAVRLALALAVSVLLLVDKAKAARGVWDARSGAIARAQTELAGARCVAVVDAGWVGAATAAEVLDLAGVTDPRIARLPGSHTSKQLPDGLLEERNVDRVLVLTIQGPIHSGAAEGLRVPDHYRPADRRAEQLALRAGMRVVGSIPLAGAGLEYDVFGRPRW